MTATHLVLKMMLTLREKVRLPASLYALLALDEQPIDESASRKRGTSEEGDLGGAGGAALLEDGSEAHPASYKWSQ